MPKLLRPLDYLRVRHKAKRKYDIYFPLALAAVILALHAFLLGRPNLFGEGGYINSFNALLAILTGFYIASLAAVATFDKKTLMW